jgi:Orsellinic acid/F9775 biosynthesis cluster protein D
MKQGWSGRVWDGRMDRYIKHNSEFGLAICVMCRSGIPKDYLLRHFWRNHGATWKECKKALTAYVASLNLAATADLQCPEGVRSPIDGLEVKDGWACEWEDCTVCSISEEYVEKHCRKTHGKEAVKSKPWYSCRLQTLLGHPHIK